MTPPNPFIPFAPHHLYIGLMLVTLAILMIPHRIYRPIMFILFILGIILMVDDFIEHTVTEATPFRYVGKKIIFGITSFFGVEQPVTYHYIVRDEDGNIEQEWNKTYDSSPWHFKM